MRASGRAIGIVVVTLLMAAWPCAAQGTAPASSAAPALTPEEMERFLREAKIVATIKVSKGVTNARQVRLSDDHFTHDAQIQDVDIARPFFEVDPKHTEVNFKDSYRYNIAAYRLSVMLGLDNVPMSIERTVERKPAAMTWWIDNVMMEEGDRLKKKAYGPNPARTLEYIAVLRVFDELIQNRDRNQGNLLWTTDWKMWMIDHTRAFRLGKELQKPLALERCERTMFQKMKELTAPGLADVMGTTLKKDEIEALLARRDAIVRTLEIRIAQKGEDAVLFDLHR